MKFGLDDETLNTIIETIKKYPDVSEAIIFGSRAIGNYKPTSDIDITIKGGIEWVIVNRIRSFLNEEAPRFPYKVDLIHYEDISEPTLREHIDRFGQTIFKK